MTLTKEKVDKLADLLLIGLTPEENEMILNDFEYIESNINNILKIEGIESVVPMTHTLDNFECVLRDDIADETPAIEDLLANADATDDREIEVPKVVGADE